MKDDEQTVSTTADENIERNGEREIETWKKGPKKKQKINKIWGSTDGTAEI